MWFLRYIRRPRFEPTAIFTATCPVLCFPRYSRRTTKWRRKELIWEDGQDWGQVINGTIFRISVNILYLHMRNWKSCGISAIIRGDATRRTERWRHRASPFTQLPLLSRGAKQWRCSDVGAGSYVTYKLGVTVEQSLKDKRLSADMARFLFPLAFLLLAVCSRPDIGLYKLYHVDVGVYAVRPSDGLAASVVGVNRADP